MTSLFTVALITQFKKLGQINDLDEVIMLQ
jgi:hypothetical protein